MTESAASTTAASTSLVDNELCSARATSTSDRSLERLFAPAPAGADICPRNAVQLVFLQRERQPVGIRKAKIDAVAVLQRVAFHALAVHKNAVAAVQVFDHILVVFHRNASVTARDAVVSQHQIVFALPADQKRHRIDGHAAAIPGWIGDGQGRRPADCGGWPTRRLRRLIGQRHQRLRAMHRLRECRARSVAAAGSGTSASVNSFARRDLAVGTVPAHLRPRQDDLKSEMSLDLFAHLLQQVAKELFDFAAAQANHVGMFLFQPRLVVVLVAIVMHQVQLVHQAACLQQLQRPVHGDAVQLRIFFARQREQTFGIQMLAGLIDQIEQNLPLAREPNALLFQRIFNAGNRHERKPEDPTRRVPKQRAQ